MRTNKEKYYWRLKTCAGILFNIAGAYLLFYPSEYPYWFYKIFGVIGLLFSYYIFYADIKEDLK